MIKSKYLIISVICILAIYIIPYFIPLSTAAYSLSYEVGYNNKASVVLLIFTIICFACISYFCDKRESLHIINDSGNSQYLLDRKTWHLSCLIGIIYIVFIYILVGKELVGIGETAYFTFAMQQLDLGRLPYKDYAYLYGPITLYLPYVIHKLGLGVVSSYILCFTTIFCIGNYCMYYIINTLDCSRKEKHYLFWFSYILIFPIALGLNYVYLRFLIPVFCLLLIDKSEKSENYSRIHWIILISLLWTLGYSPEVGAVYTITLIIYSLTSFIIHKKKVYLGYLIEIVIVSTLFVTLFNKMFITLLTASQGVNNLPLIPSIFTLCFLIAEVLLAIESGLWLRNIQANKQLLMIFTYTIGMLPASLGRSDCGHMYFYSFLVMQLGYLVISKRHYINNKLLIIIFACLFIMPNFFGIKAYSSIFSRAAVLNIGRDFYNDYREIATKIIDKSGRDIKLIDNKFAELERKECIDSIFDLTKVRSITMPYLDQSKYAQLYYCQLANKGIYQDLYFNKIYYSATENVLRERLTELKNKNIEYCILPSGWNKNNTNHPDCSYINILFMTYYPITARHKAIDIFKNINSYIENNYSIVQANDNWELYKKYTNE